MTGAICDYGRDELAVMDNPWAGERLRDIRQQADLRQSHVAELLSKARVGVRSAVAQAMVSQWESGRRTPDADDIYDLCQVLHVNCVDLYRPVGTPVRFRGGKPQPPDDDA